MKFQNFNLKFKILSDNETDIAIDINNENWMLDKETEGGFTNSVYIYIYGQEDDDGKIYSIGVLYGRYFKIDKIINKKASLFDVFDSIDQDTYMAYDALVDEEGYINMNYCGIKFNIFHIERFYIEEKYRNQGVGEKVLIHLDDILNYSLNCEIGCYILQPSPITKDANDSFITIRDNSINNKLKKRLLKFYEKCGYEKIPSTDFMYLNTD